MEELELYKYIYQDSEMGIFSLKTLLEQLKNKDNKITKTVEEILMGYERYFEHVKSVLDENNVSAHENSLMTKMGASMGIMKQVKKDNSDSSIADVLIKGVSMGSIDMEKKINNCEKHADKKELKFANDFLQFQQDVITGLKKFL